tara:strand:+ start:496 stop:1053 length:558 start_codon:yes stop_codon:yes gene_type:complete
MEERRVHEDSARIKERGEFAIRTFERLNTDSAEVSFGNSAEFGLDVLERIAAFCDLRSVGVLRRVNRQWRSAFYQESIMRAVIGSSYILCTTLYAMLAKVGCECSHAIWADAEKRFIKGFPGVLSGKDALDVLHEHDISWKNIARVYSEHTALSVALKAMPVASYAIYGLERQRTMDWFFEHSCS